MDSIFCVRHQRLWTVADWLAPCVRLGDTATAWTSERLLCGDEGKDLSEDWVAGPFFGVDDLALFAGDVMLDPPVSVIDGLRMVIRTCLALGHKVSGRQIY